MANLENSVWAVPFVGVCCAEFLGYAGVEAECKHAPHVAFAVCWTEHFAITAVGSLVE